MEREPCYTVCVSVDVCKREREIGRERGREKDRVGNISIYFLHVVSGGLCLSIQAGCRSVIWCMFPRVSFYVEALGFLSM